MLTVKPNKDKATLGMMMRRNNPSNEPVGPFTGRCAFCGSQDIWATDSPKAELGCNCCGARHAS